MGENFRGEMRLKAANAKGKADVTDVACDVIVDSANFFEIGMRVASKFLGFGADFRRRNATVTLEARVPGRELGPVGERGDPDAAGIQFGGRFEQRLDVRESGRRRQHQGPLSVEQVGSLPGPNVAVSFLAQFGAFGAGGGSLDGNLGRNAKFDALLEADVVADQVPDLPDFPGRQGAVGGDGFVLENVPRREAGYHDVFLAKVGVGGCRLGEGRAHLLDRLRPGGDHLAVRLNDPHSAHFKLGA